jgi:transcriptional regulator with XRE-family HTH domain
MATIKERFGERVQKLRKEMGISQEEFAARVGVHRTYMGFIERGERNPSLTKIYKISSVLKVSLSDLFKF